MVARGYDSSHWPEVSACRFPKVAISTGNAAQWWAQSVGARLSAGPPTTGINWALSGRGNSAGPGWLGTSVPHPPRRVIRSARDTREGRRAYTDGNHA